MAQAQLKKVMPFYYNMSIVSQKPCRKVMALSYHGLVHMQRAARLELANRLVSHHSSISLGDCH